MSKKSLILALSRGAWLVSDNYISTYFPMVSKFLTGEPVSFFDDIEEENQAKSKPYAVALISGSLKIFNSYDEAPQGSVAIIPVNGPILKEDNCGAPGTATLGSRLKQADEHPNISAHLLDIDSGGGSVDGTFEFADIIKNRAKPVVAFVNGTMASAAYAIGSSAKEIIASHKTAQIGSIGTAVSFYDNSERLKELGYKLIYINADSSPDKNQNYFEALNGNEKPIKENSLNPTNAIFLQTVKDNRSGKLKMDGKEPLTGKMYLAEQAIELGLVDSIGTFDQAIQRASELAQGNASAAQTSNNQSTNNTMKVKAMWGAMAAFLSATFSGFKADETILSEEHLEKMNTELATHEAVKAAEKKANEDLVAANATIQTLTDEKATLTAEVEKLKGASAGATTTHKQGTDSVATTADNDWQKELSELSHNKAVDSNPLLNTKK